MIYLLLAIIASIMIVILTKKGKLANTPAANSEQRDIIGLFANQTTIQNDDVEQLLNVSDSTAQRILGEMVKNNLLIRHGKTGRGVYYTKK